MRTITVRQPWAWLIIYGGKTIENRDWPTTARGRTQIHAGKGMTHKEYKDAANIAKNIGITVPPMRELERGGIIGSVEITDCVKASPSPWFFGKYGFVLTDPRPLKFLPFKGQLGFFDAPESVPRPGVVHFDIMGDETTDPDAFMHCAKCLKVIEGGPSEEWICAGCGQSLDDADDLITGRMLKEKKTAVEKELAEWVELNGTHT